MNVTEPLISSDNGVLLIGGGPINNASLQHALRFAQEIVCADGGLSHILQAGLVPNAVIGDLDSADAQNLSDLPEGVVMKIAEQDTTDFEKCLRSIEAPFFIGLGFLGGALDHTLAALSALAKHSGAPLVLLGEEELAVHLTEPFEIRLCKGTRLSLFPLQEMQAHSEGLKWPLDGLRLAPMGTIGTSNEVAQNPVRITAHERGLIMMLHKSKLERVLAAMGLTAPARPAHQKGD